MPRLLHPASCHWAATRNMGPVCANVAPNLSLMAPGDPTFRQVLHFHPMGLSYDFNSKVFGGAKARLSNLKSYHQDVDDVVYVFIHVHTEHDHII